jgi:competence protein ComEC
LGIFLQLRCDFNAVIIHSFGLGLIFIYVIYRFIERYRSFQFRYVSGIFVYFFVFLGGVCLLQVNKAEPFPHCGKKLVVEAVLCEELQEKANSYKADLHITKVRYDEMFETCQSNVVAYFEKSHESGKLRYGDKIIFEAIVNDVTTPGNPEEFDYRTYMFNRGIVGQVYIKESKFNIIERNKGNIIFAVAYKLRNSLSNVYVRNGIEGRELAVLNALSLGDQSEIDPETRQSYAYSGATHILSVSGLHVGIIYVLFNFFLKFLERLKSKRFRYGLWIKVVILLLFLWGFALLSGLSPSVKRAALMFSFVVLGQAGKRYVSIYNSLAASAFVLLIINPYDITDIGFQLSYIAVISIVLFQPVITRLFTIKNRVLYYVWSLTAVSIAAQIGTFPVTLYYFHMFPNYFILTNLFVIPLSTGILYLSVLMPVFSFSAFISKYIGILLKYTVYGLNDSVQLIERIPFSYSNHIRFDASDVLFVYLIIVFVSLFLFNKSSRYFKSALIVTVLWISWSSIGKFIEADKTEMIVYNINGETAVNLIGDKNYLIADSSILIDDKLKYGALNYWVSRGKPDFEYININQANYENEEIVVLQNYICFENHIIVLINEQMNLDRKPKIPLEADYIILSKNAKIDLKQLSEVFKFKVIVFDASNDYYYTKAKINACDNLMLNSYSVSQEGAYHKVFPK